MSTQSSRRRFLAAGLALPAALPAGLGSQAAGELRFRTLGRTGLKVTSVGFGCMITSDPSVIEKAADLGINYFDTARGYQSGNNERMVGAALKGKRKNVILSSKTHGSDKAAALAELDTSLRELGTEYLDIWYLHALSRPEQVTDELVEAQQTAKQQGKIRFAGVSTHGGQKDLIPALIRIGKIDVVLSAYNFTMDSAMSDALAEANKAGMGVVAMKVMAGGFRRVRPGDPLYSKFKQEGAMVAALKWVLKNPNIHTTIPSITDMDQLDENLRAMPASFTPGDEQLLSAQLDYIRPLYCRMCGRCDGRCPLGLPVSDILRYLSYAEGYRDFRLGRESFLALPAEVTKVRCNLCPTCAIECPNGVQVAERLIRAQELFA